MEKFNIGFQTININESPEHIDIATSKYQQHFNGFVNLITKLLKEHPKTMIYCHTMLTLGDDMTWAFAAAKINQITPRVKLVVHTPNSSQPEKFNPTDHKYWTDLYNQASINTMHFQRNFQGCYQKTQSEFLKTCDAAVTTDEIINNIENKDTFRI